MEGSYLCAYEGFPVVPPVPGTNLFIAKTDLTTPPDAEGNRLIHCRSMDDSKVLKVAYYAYKQLVKLAF